MTSAKSLTQGLKPLGSSVVVPLPLELCHLEARSVIQKTPSAGSGPEQAHLGASC